MKRELHSGAIATLSIRPIAAAALAIGIFVVDTITGEIAVAVFYVVVVLSAVSLCRKRDILLISAVCMTLTIINAIEAISACGEGPRELRVSSVKDGSNGVLVTVCDSGRGLGPGKLDDIFDAFYSTKPHGMGMGLAVTRSIVEAHGGLLWAKPNEPRGAVFQFTLPTGQEESS
ncbi:MAG: ATP-binding protein [Candidatus Binatia bacterium]